MIDLSVVTTMTNPEDRNDPWKEALDCYNQIADELVVVGEDWPYEFKFDHIGKTFQKGFDKQRFFATGKGRKTLLCHIPGRGTRPHTHPKN